MFGGNEEQEGGDCCSDCCGCGDCCGVAGYANMLGMGESAAGENEEVTEQSGFERLCGSVLCLVCAAPCFLIGAMILWGWNEKRAVCFDRAINQGKDAVAQIDCLNTGEKVDELVMFSCDIDKAASFNDFKITTGDFANQVSHTGAGLQTIVEMLQCVETVSSSTKKDNVGGGKTTTSTYSYKMEWRSTPQRPSFSKAATSSDMSTNCGIMSETPNPAFPSSAVAKSTQVTSKSIHVGMFQIDKGIYSASSVPLDSPVEAKSTPSGWTEKGEWYESDKWVAPGSTRDLGKVRVKFVGSAPGAIPMTVLGENSKGVIKQWESEPTWLCDGQEFADARVGTIGKKELFEMKKDENSSTTWILRLLGLLLAWFAFSRVVGPIGVLADCIPCIGPCLGDMVEAIGCVVAYFPACACGMFICGIVWVAMRPMVGIPLMLLCFAIFGFFVYWRMKSSAEKLEKDKNDCPGPSPDQVGKCRESE